MTSHETTGDYVGAFGNRSGPRTTTGCRTCRLKKVKCDETRPICQRCARLSRICDWTVLPRKRPSDVWRQARYRPLIPPHAATAAAEDARHDAPWRPSPAADAAPTPAVSTPTCPPSPDDELLGGGYVLEHHLSNALGRSALLSPFLGGSDTLPCGLHAGQQDHEAIFLYKTWFASSVDTKHTDYSVPAIVLRTIISEPAGMHMVLAIGRQLLRPQRSGHGIHGSGLGGDGNHALVAMEHYGQALRLLSELMLKRGSSLGLDIALATLWLMIVYEQRFGEKPIQAVRAHLDGALSILTTVNLRRMLKVPGRGDRATQSQRAAGDHEQHESGLSCLGARLLVWLLGLDARAATFGQGGALNKAIARCLGIDHLKEAVDDWFCTLSSVYERSAPLFRVTWGPEYPTTEVLYDIRHKEIFDLFRDCSQLRLMVSEIHQTTDTATRQARISATKKKLRDLEQQHADLFSVASMMPASVTDIGEELTMTLCWVMPHYQASVLDFLHARGHQGADDQRRLAAARDILKLAIYGYHKQGTPALVRVAWPLFMAGLETPDLFQQDWIVDRFKELGSYGRSYQTAADVLEKMHATRRLDATKNTEPNTAVLKETLSSGAFFI